MLGNPLCTNFAITKLFVDYVMHSSFAYRQFNNNITCGDPTILPYELIHKRNRGTIVHDVRLPRARQVLGVYASRLITLTTGIWCTVRDTGVGIPLSPYDKFVKHPPLLREEIAYLLFVLIWRNPSCNELRKQLYRNEDIDAKPLTTQMQLGIPPRHLRAGPLTRWDLIQSRYI
ncbi:hypothetical protein AVEN_225737-1 [Araneus ventricosus]|uniref:Uncharacterized protein n=1 Tax=Araneus ventricosus TaxID=182803 RepID=A0A4Y2FVG8_ARAVE|nr:hypothetical protein AVEN_225737-1 [Araneus ventricosus]